MMTDQERRRSRFTEEIVLHKGTAVAERLIKMGRRKDAEAVLAASVLVSDVLAAEYGRAPRPDAGLVWDDAGARYVKHQRAEDLNPGIPGAVLDTIARVEAEINTKLTERGVLKDGQVAVFDTSPLVRPHRAEGEPSYIFEEHEEVTHTRTRRRRGLAKLLPLSPEVLDAEYAEEEVHD